MAGGSVLRGTGSAASGFSPEAVAADHTPQSRSHYSSPEALFYAQNDSLVRALTFSCGDHALAEDSVQEAFARLLMNWKRISNYDDPATWVRRVALNLVQDHRRFLLRRAQLLVRLRRKPVALTYSMEGNSRLWNAVHDLPSRQRTALALYYLGELRVADVAAAMKVSEGTVKGYLDRARETLRKKLETSHEL
jgi:RNA polymerase sigma-70 factor (ECF subfamily)